MKAELVGIVCERCWRAYLADEWFVACPYCQCVNPSTGFAVSGC